jgi:hypothetical protein
MTDDDSTSCPSCDAPAPKAQIETLGECERCHYNSDQEITSASTETRKSSDASIIAKWQK